MAKLEFYLQLGRCPHCSMDKPNLECKSEFRTTASNGSNTRFWRDYSCASCGGAVIAWSHSQGGQIGAVYPDVEKIDENLPTRVKAYLQQAIDSQFAPAGSLMLCASAVDAMLKEKGYVSESLYKRIDNAANDNLITTDMAKWAHRVRLDANDQRHSDINSDLPTIEDAAQAVQFTKTLAELLFVLPAKVNKGLQDTEPQ